MIAVGSDDRSTSNGGKVFIYEYNESTRRWDRVETLSTITDPVGDLAFAPNIGRSYSVLAVASKELRMVTLKPATDAGYEELRADEREQGGIPTKYDVRIKSGKWKNIWIGIRETLLSCWAKEQ